MKKETRDKKLALKIFNLRAGRMPWKEIMRLVGRGRTKCHQLFAAEVRRRDPRARLDEALIEGFAKPLVGEVIRQLLDDSDAEMLADGRVRVTMNLNRRQKGRGARSRRTLA